MTTKTLRTLGAREKREIWEAGLAGDSAFLDSLQGEVDQGLINNAENITLRIIDARAGAGFAGTIQVEPPSGDSTLYPADQTDRPEGTTFDPDAQTERPDGSTAVTQDGAIFPPPSEPITQADYSAAINSSRGSPNYRADLDIDGDGTITTDDFFAWSEKVSGGTGAEEGGITDSEDTGYGGAGPGEPGGITDSEDTGYGGAGPGEPGGITDSEDTGYGGAGPGEPIVITSTPVVVADATKRAIGSSDDSDMQYAGGTAGFYDRDTGAPPVVQRVEPVVIPASEHGLVDEGDGEPRDIDTSAFADGDVTDQSARPEGSIRPALGSTGAFKLNREGFSSNPIIQSTLDILNLKGQLPESFNSREEAETWFHDVYMQEVLRILGNVETTTEISGDFENFWGNLTNRGAQQGGITSTGPGEGGLTLPPELEDFDAAAANVRAQLSGLSDLTLTAINNVGALSSTLESLGLPGTLATDITDLLRGDSLIVDLRGELLALGVPDNLQGDLLDAVGDVSALGTALSGLKLDPQLEKDIYGLLELDSPLALLGSRLSGLKLDPQLEKDIYGLLELDSPLALLGSRLSGLKLDPQLEKDIYGLLELDSPLALLGSRLSGLGIPDTLATSITNRIADVNTLNTALTGLDIPDELGREIFGLLNFPGSDLNTLKSGLAGLKLPGDLNTKLTTEINRVGLLQGALSSLGLPDQLSRDINLLLSGGIDDSSLTQLRTALGDVGLDPELNTSILSTIGEVNNLSSALSSIEGLGLQVSGDIFKSLSGSLDLIRGTHTTEGLEEVLQRLNVPGALAGDLSDRIIQARDLDSAIVGLSKQGVTVNKEIQEALSSNLALIQDPDGLADVLGKLKVPQAFADSLNTQLGRAKSVRGIVNGLNVPDEFRRQLSEVLASVNPDDPESLTGILSDLAFRPETIQQIGTTLSDLRELESILSTAGVDPEFRGQVSDALMAGEDLSTALARLNLPNPQEVFDKIDVALRQVGDLDAALSAAGLTEIQVKQISDALDTTGDLDEALKAVDLPAELEQRIKDAIGDTDTLADRLTGLQEQLTGIEIPPDIGDRLAAIEAQAASAGSEIDLFGTAAGTALAGVEKGLAGVGAATESTFDEFGNEITAARGALSEIEDRLAGLDTNLSADLKRALQRPQGGELESALFATLTEVIKDIGFDPEVYRTAQQDILDQRFKRAQDRLAQQFGIDPGGTRSGKSQVKFEELESAYLEDKRQIDVEVQNRIDSVRQQSIQNLSNALGIVSETTLGQQRLFEDARQYDEAMALKLQEFGLTEAESEATIRKINAEIANSTRAVSSEIGQRWAEITGRTGTGTEEISLADLGIDASEIPRPAAGEAPLDLFGPEANAIRESFEAFTGQKATLGEVMDLMEGNSISVEGMATLEARKAGAAIAGQEMERIAKYDAIAEENNLARAVFNQGKTEADRAWNETTLDVGEEFGFEPGIFRLSKFRYDNVLRSGGTEEEALAAAVGDDGDPANFLRANDQFDRVFGLQRDQIADNLSMNRENFEKANDSAERIESRTLDVWASLLDSERQEFGFTHSKYEDISADLTQFATDLGISKTDTAQEIQEALETADPDAFELLRSRLSARWAIVPEEEFAPFFKAFLESDGEKFQYEAIKRDWFDELDQAEQGALIALLGISSSIIPDPKDPSLAQILGMIAGRTAEVVTAVRSGTGQDIEGP